MKSSPFLKITSSWGNNHQAGNQRLIKILTRENPPPNFTGFYSERRTQTASEKTGRRNHAIIMHDQSGVLQSSRINSRQNIRTTKISKNKLCLISSSSRSLALGPWSNRINSSRPSSKEFMKTTARTYRKTAKLGSMVDMIRSASNQQLFRNRKISGVVPKTGLALRRTPVENQESELEDILEKQRQFLQRVSKKLYDEKNETIDNFTIDYCAFNYLNKVIDIPNHVWQKQKYVHKVK